MVIIRAITIHVPEHIISRDSVEKITRSVTSIVERCKGLLKKHSLDCWGFRASFPAIKDAGRKELSTLAKYLGEFSDACNLITAGLHLTVVKSVDDYKELVESLKTNRRLYGSVLVSDVKQLDWYVECLSKYYNDPEVFTRLAVIFPKQVLTPYFPVSTSYGGLWGISIALRYADLVKEVIKGIRDYDELIRYVRNVFNLCRDLEYEAKVRCFGLDLSLSPWMQESVGELVELLGHARIPDPGCGWGIYKLNGLIKQLALDSGVDIVGFNEVMLPVAEDSLLKRRVLERRLRITDLAYFTAFCVPGVDMIATYLGSEIEKERLRKLLYDVYAIGLTKGRNIGIRIIPATTKPGGFIRLNLFGDVPVAEV